MASSPHRNQSFGQDLILGYFNGVGHLASFPPPVVPGDRPIRLRVSDPIACLGGPDCVPASVPHRVPSVLTTALHGRSVPPL